MSKRWRFASVQPDLSTTMLTRYLIIVEKLKSKNLPDGGLSEMIFDEIDLNGLAHCQFFCFFLCLGYCFLFRTG